MTRLLLAALLALPGLAFGLSTDNNGIASTMGATLACPAGGKINFDSNTQVIDCTNNRVGIGTASPTTLAQFAGGTVQISSGPLFFNGAITAPYLRFYEGGNQASIKHFYGNGNNAIFGMNGNGAGYCGAVGTEGGWNITFCPDGGVAMGSYAPTTNAPANSLIVSDDFGLGTPTPRSRLDVNGKSTFRDAMTVSGSSLTVNGLANGDAAVFKSGIASAHRFRVQSDGSNVYLDNQDAGGIKFRTNATDERFFISNAGNVTSLSPFIVNGASVTVRGKFGGGGTVPTIASCGTGATIVGSDIAGKVTLGTGGATGCVVTFSAAWTNAPACVVTNETTANLFRATSLTNQVTLAGTGLASDVLAYICVGYN